MKVAVSATEGSLDAAVDPRFGRAMWFLIVDTKTGELIEAIDNSAGKEAAHGAGISAAALVADKGVQAVLTGRVGPKAMPVLEKANVKVIDNISGTVLDAVSAFSGKSEATPSQVSNQTTSAGFGAGQGCGQGRGGGQGRGQGRGMGQGRGQCRRK